MKKLIVITTLSTLFAIQVTRANTIADWTFETSQPVTAGPFNPEVGSGSALGSHAGATAYSTPAGNGSSHSFSSTVWAVGDYYQFSVSTVGFQNIQLSFDQVSSSTGPGKFILQYSIDGTTFSPFGTDYTVLVNASPNAWSATAANHITTTTFSDDLSAIIGLNNDPTVFFRLVDDSTTSANGGTTATGGTDRVDNFIISGDAISAPDQTSTFVLMAMGVSACVVFQRKKNFSLDVYGRAEQ